MQLFLSILGIFLSVILLYFNARENKSTIYLGSFLILTSLSSLHRYVVHYSDSVTPVAIFLVNFTFVYYLVGPSLFFYIRSILTDDPSLKRKDLWHLLTLVIFLVICAPYLITSWEFKKEVAEQFTRTDTDQTRYMAEILGSRLWLKIYIITPLLVILGYVFLSSAMLIIYVKQKKERLVFNRQRYALPWIKAFVGVVLILTLIYLYIFIRTFVFEHSHFYSIYKRVDIFLMTGPLILLIMAFFSPGLLYGLPRVPEIKEKLKNDGKSSDVPVKNEKPTPVQLESGYLRSIGLEADACMENQQPYTNPAFTLAELSVLIHIPVHHLSYYFREEKKQSFLDYRNEWRVKHAKKLILEGMTGEMTLEAIGTLSGFPNRDSFRTAFQRIEGLSPAVFLGNLQY